MQKNMAAQIKKPAKLYDKKCPKCGKGNLQLSAYCWNCGYEFEENIAWKGPEAEKHKVFWDSTLVKIAFIIGIIILVFIVLDIMG